MVTKSEIENKNVGARKIAVGISVAAVGTVFYGFVLPSGMIVAFTGFLSNVGGMIGQVFSKKDSKFNKASSRIRAVGAGMVGAGLACATSPVLGSLYAIEGGYSLYTGKKSNIIGNVSNFVFGVIAGPKYRKKIDFKNKVKRLEGNVRDDVIRTQEVEQSKEIPQDVKGQAMKATSRVGKLEIGRSRSPVPIAKRSKSRGVKLK